MDIAQVIGGVFVGVASLGAVLWAFLRSSNAALQVASNQSEGWGDQVDHLMARIEQLTKHSEAQRAAHAEEMAATRRAHAEEMAAERNAHAETRAELLRERAETYRLRSRLATYER